ncbi:MAG: hypothetical protein AB7K35_14605 [Pseudorhodoplanes sp.]
MIAKRNGVAPWMAGVSVLTALMAFALFPRLPAKAQQPCNPIVDGTYCTTQMGSSRPAAGGGTGMPSIGSIAADISPGQERAATLGAITFQGNGARCIGLLRQSNCK